MLQKKFLRNIFGSKKPELYSGKIDDSGNNDYAHRLLVGTATLGTVRIEWVIARYGLVTPVNFSLVQQQEFYNSYYPVRYQVADAQNLIVKEAIDNNFEWLLLYEHDVMPQPNALFILNEYMTNKDVPVVSGLYYTRGVPSEPLVFRGRGNGAYTQFSAGDKIWCDGVPTGMLLIHCSVLRAMWDESPEYTIGNRTTRMVFETPRKYSYSPDQSWFSTSVGTSDLAWCTRVINDNIFAKSGWNNYANKQYPFLVDTRLFCWHINTDGVKFPIGDEFEKFII